MSLPENIDECWIGSDAQAQANEPGQQEPLAAAYIPLEDMTAFELQAIIPHIFLGRPIFNKSQLPAGALRHFKFLGEQDFGAAPIVQSSRFIDDPKYRVVRDELKDDPSVSQVTELADEDTLTVGSDVWLPPVLRDRWKKMFDAGQVSFVS